VKVDEAEAFPPQPPWAMIVRAASTVAHLLGSSAIVTAARCQLFFSSHIFTCTSSSYLAPSTQNAVQGEFYTHFRVIYFNNFYSLASSPSPSSEGLNARLTTRKESVAISYRFCCCCRARLAARNHMVSQIYCITHENIASIVVAFPKSSFRNQLGASRGYRFTISV
jgi:hypothetical protein